MKRAAIYTRVSTTRQENQNQLLQMKKFVKAQGWAVSLFEDQESGKTDQRSAFQAMLQAAARREFDVVVFWSLDRFSREGALPTLNHLNTLSSYGVGFRSFTEPYLDSCGLFRDAIVAILGTIAKQERVRLSERVKAGLERSKVSGTRSGKPIGRPRRVFDREKVQDFRKQGLGFGAIAGKLGISKSTVKRACGLPAVKSRVRVASGSND